MNFPKSKSKLAGMRNARRRSYSYAISLCAKVCKAHLVLFVPGLKQYDGKIVRLQNGAVRYEMRRIKTDGKGENIRIFLPGMWL